MISRRFIASNDDIDVGAFSKIVGLSLTAGSATATCTIFNSITQSGGDEVAQASCVTLDSKYQNFGKQGIVCPTGISITIGGTGAVLFLYLE